MSKYRSQSEIRREMKEHRAFAYLKAKKNGFDKNYCSGRVKFFTKEEIAEYESNLKKSTT